MAEKVTSLKLEEAYDELKKRLFILGSKILAEDPPRSIVVEHGSHWAFTPRNVKKKINFYFASHPSGVKIVATSSLSSEWGWLSTIIYVLLAVAAGFLWWWASDLRALATAARESFWGWIFKRLFGYVGFQQILAIAGILEVTAIIVSILVLISILADVYKYCKRDALAEELLRTLP